jgi:hypothetical protein
MKTKAVTILLAISLAFAAVPVANAAKSAGHKAPHHKAMNHKAAPHHVKAKVGCKTEFMYMKGGKCMDARAKAAT